MTGSKGRAPIISLGDDFGTAVVQGGGITVELSDNGDVTVQTNGNVKLRPAANDHAKPEGTTEPKPGDSVADGTIYAGISPDTHKPMYVTPQDASLTYTFNAAQKYAAKLDANGHQDWRVPTKGELNVLYENRNKGKLAGTFNVTGSDPAGWYWSSSPNDSSAWAQRFSDGSQYLFYRIIDSSLRCVR
jgi:Protein of unknown function (DUF1566)